MLGNVLEFCDKVQVMIDILRYDRSTDMQQEGDGRAINELHRTVHMDRGQCHACIYI